MSENPKASTILPFYGKLRIKDYKTFLNESKKAFYERYNTVYHSDISMSNYDVSATLGRGSFGTVKLVKEKKSERYYAAKIQNKTKIKECDCVNHVFFEKRVLYGIDFPFCVRMEHYCHDDDFIYFLMPFVRGGELYTLIKKFKYFQEKMARFYAAQVVLALEFFQYIHFIYRDLKPENILVDHTGFLKITDFGLCKHVEDRTYTICGTPAYMAPEVIKGNGYARSADWWSLGILIFEMTTGIFPFTAEDTTKLFTNIMYAPVPMYNIFSPNLRRLLRGLLDKDVTRRLGNLRQGADDVKKHPWFKTIDWLQILNRNVPPPYVPKTTGPADTSYFPSAARTADSEYTETPSARKTVFEDPLVKKAKEKNLTLRSGIFSASRTGQRLPK